MVFDNTHWSAHGGKHLAQESAKKLVEALAEKIANWRFSDLEQEKAMKKMAKSMQRRAFITNTLTLAESDPSLLDLGTWDEDEGLLNFQNGTLTLNDRVLRNHDPEDRLTEVLPFAYDPDAQCPNFDKVCDDALDKETADFLMEMFGYALMGTGELQRMLLLIGSGRNGKSTITEAVGNALGSYATTADPNSFMKGKLNNGMNNDLYALKKARLVLTSELNTGQTLDSALVKRFTGGEEVSARALYKDFETFRPRGLVTMVSNMPPVFDGSDFGIARRLVVVPFGRTIDEEAVDYDLPRKLKGEAPGIINRLLEGLERYQAKGFQPSAVVKAATEACIADANQVARFIEDRCVLEKGAKTGARELHSHYTIWCSLAGLKPMSEASFRNAMERTASCTRGRSAAGYFWHGIKLN